MDCIWCSVELTDENWYSSSKKKGDYKCKPCIRNKENKANKLHRLCINGKYISRKDPLHKMFKPGYYKTLGDATFFNSKLAAIQEGYVYIISNRAWPHWVKIGMAIDAEDRLNSYQTSSPYRDYILEHRVFSSNRRASEQEAHTKAAAICRGMANEWFELSVKEAITILDNLDEQHRTVIKADTHEKEDNLQGSLL
jgi:hypothetical protein